jgi:prepilin-type N-terminal cleavage/methylation domain-containing protein
MNCRLSRRKMCQGMSYIEMLVAVVILSIVAAGGLATWGFSSRVPVSKRLTNMGSLLVICEIERLKAQGYSNLVDGTTVHWYDKYGSFLSTGGSAPSGAVYKTSSTVQLSLSRNGSSASDTEDLREIVVTVQNADASKTYETQRTLLTFGGF